MIKLIPNKVIIIDVRLCPRCALPSPHSRPIDCIACTQNFPNSYLRLPGILNDPFCCMTLLAIEWSLLQRTRQRQLQQRLPMLLNGPDKPPSKIVHSSWDFVVLPEEDRATAISNMHRKIGKDRECGFGDMLADRRTDTHTDVLITLLRHRSRGRSNYKPNYSLLLQSSYCVSARQQRYIYYWTSVIPHIIIPTSYLYTRPTVRVGASSVNRT